MSSTYQLQKGGDEAPVNDEGILTFPDVLQLPAQVDASLLPTEDPAIVGRVYSNSGVLTISAG